MLRDASGITGVEKGCGELPCSVFFPLDSRVEILFAPSPLGSGVEGLKGLKYYDPLTYVTSPLLISPVRKQMQKLFMVHLKLKINQGEPGTWVLVPSFYLL